MEKKQFLEAGQIINTHGIKGEVMIRPWADSAQFLLSFKTIYIDEKSVKILSGRVHKGGLIALFEGVGDINTAMRLKGKTVFINRDDAKLPEGEFFLQDIIGAEVREENGSALGVLDDVLEMPASNVYVVRGEREILIPAVPQFVLDTDVTAGIITVRLIEGM